MEYVAGGSLRSLSARSSCRRSSRSWRESLAGLAHAEHHGIAHRDLKPENVLVTRARQRQDRRLRDRARVQRAEPAADRDGQGDGHAGVHVAGAGPQRADRPVHGPVRARRDRLRAARGPDAVRRRHARRRPRLPRPQARRRRSRTSPRRRRPPCASGCTGCWPRSRANGRARPRRPGTRSRRSRSRSSGPTGGAPRRSRSPARSPTRTRTTPSSRRPRRSSRVARDAEADAAQPPPTPVADTQPPARRRRAAAARPARRGRRSGRRRRGGARGGAARRPGPAASRSRADAHGGPV